MCADVQVLLPKLEHFAVESSTDVDARLLAVDGLPCMLSERCGPALKAVALKGVSQEPFSTQRASQRHRYGAVSSSNPQHTSTYTHRPRCRQISMCSICRRKLAIEEWLHLPNARVLHCQQFASART